MQPASELSVAGLLQIHAPIAWRNPDAVFSQSRIVSEHSVDGVHEQVEVDVREVGMFDAIGVHFVGVRACGTWIVEVVEYVGSSAPNFAATPLPRSLDQSGSLASTTASKKGIMAENSPYQQPKE